MKQEKKKEESNIPLPIVDAALNALTSAFDMVNKALPGTEERLLRLKLKAPLMYERYLYRITMIRLRKMRKVAKVLGISVTDEYILRYLRGEADTANTTKLILDNPPK